MLSDKALVLLAAGAEEMEATIAIDVLRRAEVHVTVAGVDGAAAVSCSRGVRLVPDIALSEVTGEFGAIVLPGGVAGAQRLAASTAVGKLLRAQPPDRFIASICAGPIALQQHQVDLGRQITSHPSVRAELESDYVWRPEAVVQDGRLITSQGPGTSFAFALALVRAMCGDETVSQVTAPMCLAQT